MVAGVVGMDLILLVIAADEGIKPQTKEHVDILNLLGVNKAIIVLNKTDLVDEEWIELVEADIKNEFEGCFLENAPIVRTSAEKNIGIDNLINEIDKICDTETEFKNSNGPAYLPIDRVFSITGSGTIVTGTLISGSISKDENLEILPLKKDIKVRSIQVHNNSCETSFAGQRTAINIYGIDKDEIYRGCVIASKNSIDVCDMFDVKLNVLDSSKRIIKNGMQVHFFTSTTQVLAKIFLLDKEELKAGEEGFAQIRTDKKIAIKSTDKFIVRFYSPLETIAGGSVLLTNTTKSKRFDETKISELRNLESGSAEDILNHYLDQYNKPILKISDIAQKSKFNEEELTDALTEMKNKGQVIEYEFAKEKIIWKCEFRNKITNAILEYARNFHNNNPYKPGVLKEEIFNEFFSEVKRPVFDLYIADCESQKLLKANNEFICDASFEIVQDEKFNRIKNTILKNLDDAKFNFIWFSDIDFNNENSQVVDDVLRYLINNNEVVKIDDNLYTLPKYINHAIDEIIKLLKKQNTITIAELRDMLDTSRKVAKPILEYTDELGITIKGEKEAERNAGNLEAVG